MSIPLEFRLIQSFFSSLTEYVTQFINVEISGEKCKKTEKMNENRKKHHHHHHQRKKERLKVSAYKNII